MQQQARAIFEPKNTPTAAQTPPTNPSLPSPSPTPPTNPSLPSNAASNAANELVSISKCKVCVEMVVHVIDFSKLDGEERATTMSEIHTGCEEWGFFQLVNHGIPEELLERVKKISSDCYKIERAENFKSSKPVTMLNELGEKLEGVDWEGVSLLTDDK